MDFYLNLFLQLVFWISFLAILHSYVYYPLLMQWLGRETTVQSPDEGEEKELPQLNVVMAMYNEESVIEDTLDSIVNCDYPKDKLNVYIGSDSSTDRSDEIVESFIKDHPFVNLKVFPGRSGKITIVNDLVAEIPEDDSLLILCDANVVWSRSLAKKLAGNFSNEKIGIVASTVTDINLSTEGIAAEEEAYVNRENRVKHAEGALWGCMMGAFGACYAMRRKCYEPVPAEFNVDDFFETLVCYERGYQGIVDLDAICYEAVSEDISEEFRRKKRISKGNFQNLKRFFMYLLPWNCGLPTAFAFWSHKGIRWFGPLLLYCVLVTGISLAWNSHWIYALAASGMLSSFVVAIIDRHMEQKGSRMRFRLFKLIRYFYVMNWALFNGGVEFFKGVNSSVWEPTRRVATVGGTTEE